MYTRRCSSLLSRLITLFFEGGGIELEDMVSNFNFFFILIYTWLLWKLQQPQQYIRPFKNTKQHFNGF